MKATNLDGVLINIFYHALKKWFVFIIFALALYINTSTFLYYILGGALFITIHITVVNKVAAITKFIELRKAVLDHTATYNVRSGKENVFHHIGALPISACLGILLASSNPIMIVSGIIGLYFLLVFGETGKYRFNLYKRYYDKYVENKVNTVI